MVDFQKKDRARPVARRAQLAAGGAPPVIIFGAGALARSR